MFRASGCHNLYGSYRRGLGFFGGPRRSAIYLGTDTRQSNVAMLTPLRDRLGLAEAYVRPAPQPVNKARSGCVHAEIFNKFAFYQASSADSGRKTVLLAVPTQVVAGSPELVGGDIAFEIEGHTH
jgi:hypothetical protein